MSAAFSQRFLFFLFFFMLNSKFAQSGAKLLHGHRHGPCQPLPDQYGRQQDDAGKPTHQNGPKPQL